jgi:hypothetical protein
MFTIAMIALLAAAGSVQDEEVLLEEVVAPAEQVAQEDSECSEEFALEEILEEGILGDAVVLSDQE